MSPMSHLAPCPECNRHVAVHELACPFCAAALPESFRARPGPALRQNRLSRAAMFAAGATLMGAAACASDGGGPMSGQPVYGAPVDSAVQADASDGAADGAADARNDGDAAGDTGGSPADAADDRGPVALYGAVPPLDAAVTPAYGIPPGGPGGTNGNS